MNPGARILASIAIASAFLAVPTGADARPLQKLESHSLAMKVNPRAMQGLVARGINPKQAKLVVWSIGGDNMNAKMTVDGQANLPQGMGRFEVTYASARQFGRNNIRSASWKVSFIENTGTGERRHTVALFQPKKLLINGGLRAVSLSDMMAAARVQR